VVEQTPDETIEQDALPVQEDPVQTGAPPRPPDVILRHPSGSILRLDPERYDEVAAQLAQENGWEPYTPPPDGFRPRRVRSPEEIQRLIAGGDVADPATGGQPHQSYGPETFVIEVPTGGVKGEGQTPG
jgi:hypothetical protein